ncbi:hypothetical protein RIR_jg23070.t1 [Rhizophagus irregularis DAOM 181602=DAOM 197198]|nr:hypothetical protein RIR_jg23070.t1 [Rhizophagus irregularis DAOM 181602=DAOM 197198]
MSTHQARSAQHRQVTRSVLAELKQVPVKSIPYPRSNAKLQEYEDEIRQIREAQAAVTNEEITRMMQIDPDPHYEVVFERRDQVRIGKELTDSNFTADIAIGTPGEHDYASFLTAHSQTIQNILQDERNRLGSIKVRIGIFATIRRLDSYLEGLFGDGNFSEDDGVEYIYRYNIPFKTRNMPILPSTDINGTFNFALARIMQKVEDYVNYGSGWEFYRVEKIFIEISQFQPPTGAGYIPLPKDLATKKGVVNPANDDDKCFQWAILAALHPVEKNAERISKYKEYVNELNFEGIEFPVQADEVILRRFERQNPTIALCICEWRDHRLCPIYVTDRDDAEGHKIIDLVLISNGEKQHYCWIKNMSRLVNKRTKDGHATFVCRWCISHFTHQQEIHDKHVAICRGLKKTPQADRMPSVKKGNDIYEFKNWKRRMQVPYYFVADFEALVMDIPPTDEDKDKKTKKVQEQIPCSYSYIKVRYDGVSESQKIFTGENAAQKFVIEMLNEAEAIHNEFRNPMEMMPLTTQEQASYDNAINCWICRNPLNGNKVRDHCHITGRYRGAAHRGCNLDLSIKPREMHIPVIFHNLSGYDGHIIMQGIGAMECEDDIDPIPYNMEKYMAFKLGSLRFIDSLQFMKSSLDKLASNLGAEKCRAQECSNPQHLWRIDAGVYPYEYMDDWKKFEKTSLPPKGAFYSKLNETHISDKEYEYAQYVWEKAGCKTMQDYHDIYLKTDVLLLADIFQNFREMALKKYGLDPLWYYSTPGFAWDALFLMTGQRLDLITDQDMYMMVEQGLRGGISMVSKRYARANNPGMGEGKWTADKPKSSILYLDANNLYGWAMLQYLPTGNFHWIKEENELSNIQRQIESNEIPDDSSEGYILKVKLEYPQALHSQHTDYPLAPERMKVKKEWLSKKQQEIIACSGQRYTPTDKLIPNLFDKDEYVVHYRNLQYYVSQGLVIKKVYEAIKFEQAPWMKPYIEFNTAERAKAKNDFEKDFYKLMNNSVFGKTMENLRKRVRVSVVQPQTHPKKYKKLTSDPAFKGRKIFSENLVAIHRRKVEVMLNRPTYVGMSVLDLSKLCMYQFYYDTLKVRYGEKIQLCYTDTDSLLVQIQTEDINADLIDMADQFDFSDYPKDHPVRKALGDKTDINMKIPGKFKDECNGAVIAEFIGLRPKMYSILKVGDETTNPKHGIRKAKGVPSKVVKKEFHHERYNKALFDPKHNDTVTFRAIRSDRHAINVIEMSKDTTT